MRPIPPPVSKAACARLAGLAGLARLVGSVCLGAAALLIGCSRDNASGRRDAAALAAAQEACDRDTIAGPCRAWGRLLMSGDAADLAEGEKEKARLGELAGRLGDEEMLGLQGAYTVRLGGMYARHEDVVTAVERVEEGLKVLSDGMAARPSSKILRIYYAVTLSHLPADFKKADEARDTIQSLKTAFQLSPAETGTLDSALSRLPR